MLDFLGPRIHLGCSMTGLALLRRDRFGRPLGIPFERSLRDAPGSVALLAQQLRAMLAEAACAGNATATLADDWFRLFIVTPPPVRHRRDLDAAVAARFRRLYDDTAADWVLQADLDAGAPFMAVAMPRNLHDALQDIAAQCRLRWIAILPHCVVAWNRWQGLLKEGDWFGIAHDNMLTLMILAGGHPVALRRLPLDQDSMKNPDWLSACMTREAASLQVPAPRRIQLCGEVPRPWTQVVPDRIACLALSEKNLPARSPDAALAQAGVPA